MFFGETPFAQIFDTLMEYLVKPVPPNIVKAALRTSHKLLENDAFRDGLKANNFDAARHLKTMYACKLDSHDQEQEEVILLLIQKNVIAIVAEYFEVLPTDEDRLATCKYFLRVLKKRALSDSVASSVHMTEGTKRHLNLLFRVLVAKVEIQQSLKVLKMLAGKIQKHLKRLESTTITAIEQTISKEYSICLLKAFIECLSSVFRLGNDEVKEVFAAFKAQLIQLTC